MEIIKLTGVKIGKIIIGVISAQIIKYTSSQEFKDRVNKILDDTISRIVKSVIAELEK